MEEAIRKALRKAEQRRYLEAADEEIAAKNKSLETSVEGVQRILRRQEVERLTGLPRSSLYDLMAKNKFPRPIRLSVKAVGWLESEILNWQRERIAARQGA